MSKTIPLACAAALLAVAGCKENLSVDRNVPPIAVAEVQGRADDLSRDIYHISLGETETQGCVEPDSPCVELILDASKSTDVDGDPIIEYIWISGTRYPDDAGTGRYIPEAERLTQEEIDTAHEAGEQLDAWPKNGVTSTVRLTWGDWYFHVYAGDDRGGLSEPATVHIDVFGAPPDAPVGDDDDAGAPGDAGSLEDDAGTAADDGDAG